VINYWLFSINCLLKFINHDNNSQNNIRKNQLSNDTHHPPKNFKPTQHNVKNTNMNTLTFCA